MQQPSKGLLGAAQKPQPTPQQPGGQTPVSEKDKQDFQQFIAQGTKMLHAPETRDGFVKRLTQGNPIQSIAEVTVMIVQRLEAAGQVSDLVKLDGANAIMKEVADVAEAAGVAPLSEEQKATCFSLAVDMYLSAGMRSGKRKPEELQQAVGGINGTA